MNCPFKTDCNDCNNCNAKPRNTEDAWLRCSVAKTSRFFKKDDLNLLECRQANCCKTGMNCSGCKCVTGEESFCISLQNRHKAMNDNLEELALTCYADHDGELTWNECIVKCVGGL